MPSRLAKLRDDTKIVWGCLAISLLILGTLATQKITAATADQQGEQQQAQLAARTSRFTGRTGTDRPAGSTGSYGTTWYGAGVRICLWNGRGGPQPLKGD